MLKYTILSILCCITIAVKGQVSPGKWQDHFSYSSVKGILVTEDKAYVPTEEGYFIYNKNSGEIEKKSRVTGLSSYGVSSLAVFDEINTIAVGYSDGSIDLVKDGKVTAIIDIKEKKIPGDRSIYSMLLFNGNIYAATGFGIVVIDPAIPEIKDTYYIGSGGSSISVYSLLQFNGSFYAATSDGLKYASISDPLLYYFEQWKNTSPPSSGNKFIGLASSGNTLYAQEKGLNGFNDKVYQFVTGGGWTTLASTQTEITSISATAQGVCVTGKKRIEIFSNGGLQTVNTFGLYSFDPCYSYFDGNYLWSADNSNGLVKYKSGDAQNFKPNGPYSNEAFRGNWVNGTLVVSRGGFDDVGASSWNGLLINIYRNNQWQSQWGTGNDGYLPAINPTDPTEISVSGWGSGITKFKNDQFSILYGESNSTLISIYPGEPYIRCRGICYDSDGNLWVNNAGAVKPISVLKPDGTWTAISVGGSINADRLGTMFFHETTGHLWMSLPKTGVFVYDKGADPFSESDDRYLRIPLTDPSGVPLSNDILSMAQDNEGKIWIGTQEGVEVIYNAESAFRQAITAQRIKIPIEIEGQAAYLLKTDAVSAIAVDGANRKWFGTMRSGAYLQSADGVDQILAFNTDNSPLPSNSILDITIDQDNGEVFFITDKGVISYRGDAIRGGAEFGKVYAFPNPVRENFNGKITIVGLIPKATVKITDINGYLVFEGESLGGEIQWDGKNLNGRRVNTGVYLIFCSDAEGEKSAVSKLLFIH
ncbi:type IX secretion system anionic LPS delivery protein PorZ [Williamwhitmania taraxaci]|uniref:Two component regulator propeller n=1 Tax=Williamwhitmania taraxaci TaxID=1640674 RepID=A0A1G6P1U0_9BACT|nr:two-component regulator propeller domain-containing protein [Williamwhitmania taraxaci]SDC73395.1 Two component regulator propeller [Williamwhitmania taraxaci]